MSHDKSPLTIASNRLLEKQKNVRDQLEAVNSRLEELRSLERDCDRAVEAAASRVDSAFVSLAQALERRRGELVRSLRESEAERRSALERHQRKCQEALSNANKVLGSSSELLQQSGGNEDKHKAFFAGYATTSQMLEESFMDLLILSHSQAAGLGEVTDWVEGVRGLGEAELDVREQLEGIQRIELPKGFLPRVTQTPCLDSHSEPSTPPEATADNGTFREMPLPKHQSSFVEEQGCAEHPLGAIRVRDSQGQTGMEPEGASHKKPPGEALLLLASYADSSGSATTQNSDTEESDDSAAVEEEGERGVKGQAVKEDSPPPRPASSFEDTTVARGNSNGNSLAGPGGVDSPGDHQEGSEESLKFTSSESATDGTEAAGEVERVQTPTSQPENEPCLGDSVQPSGLAAGDAGSQQLQEAEEIEEGREGLLTPSQLTHESSVEPHNVMSSHDMTFMSDISESPSHISLPHIEEGSDRPTGVAKLQQLSLIPGACLTVLVLEVTSPSCFIAQPYGPELVQLMDDMGSHYENLQEQGDHGGLVSPPHMGDYLSAKFTEDNFWYRARVFAIEQLLSTQGPSTHVHPHAWVKVDYVDYGNQEQLPLSHLRPLEPQFCKLPCQSLLCSLAGVQPMLHPTSSQPLYRNMAHQQDSGWPQETCNWFSKLLVGKPVDITVITSSTPSRQNEISVDVSLPSNLLFSPESLANFPVPAQSIASLSQYHVSPASLSLTSFLLTIGIAGPCASYPSSSTICHVPSTPIPVAPCLSTSSLPCSLSFPPLLTSTPWPPQSFTSCPPPREGIGGGPRANMEPPLLLSLPLPPSTGVHMASLSPQLSLLTPLYYTSALVGDGKRRMDVATGEGPPVSENAGDCPSEGNTCASSTSCSGSACVGSEPKIEEEQQSPVAMVTGDMSSAGDDGCGMGVDSETSLQAKTSQPVDHVKKDVSTSNRTDTATQGKEEQHPPTKDTLPAPPPPTKDTLPAPPPSTKDTLPAPLPPTKDTLPAPPPSTKDTLPAPPPPIVHSSNLKPLSVQLGSSGDIRVLVSHVISPSRFFVHPIQQQTISDIAALPYSLQQRYSDPSKCTRLSRDQAKVGTACCTLSPEDDLWCRGVIVSITEEQVEEKTRKSRSKEKVSPTEGVLVKKTYEVLSIDYGGFSKVNADDLWLLDKECSKFPVLSICCSLVDVCPAPPSGAIAMAVGERRDKKEPRTLQESDGERGTYLNDSGIESPPLQPQSAPVTPPSSKSHPAGARTLDATSPAKASIKASPAKESALAGSPGEASWSTESMELFRQLTEDKRLVAIVAKPPPTSFTPSSAPSPSSSFLLPSWDTVLHIQLFDTNGENDVCIADSLVEAGLAIKKEDTSMDVHSSAQEEGEAISPSAPVPPSPTSPGTKLQAWNPMEKDFLSARNIYKIDDQDASSALQGYRSTNRVCWYYKPYSGCLRGTTCPFLHLEPGQRDEQLEEVYAADPGPLTLPTVGAWVVIIVTAVLSATRFYVQLPLGSNCRLATRDTPKTKSEESDAPMDMDYLLKKMTSYYNHQTTKDREWVYQAKGEIVAVRYIQDEQWYRARILGIRDDIVQVYLVDYGHPVWVEEGLVRSIRPEFMHLPFQAVECCMCGVQVQSKYRQSHEKRGEAREVLKKLVKDRALVAHVMWKGWNGVLGVELYDTSGPEGDMGPQVNLEMIRRGILSPVSSPLLQGELLGEERKQQPKRQGPVLLPG